MSLRAVVHLLIAGHFCYGCYYDWNYVIIPEAISNSGDSIFNSGKLKYLTYWDAILQCVFFTVCFLNDMFGTNEDLPKKKPFIRIIKDILLPSLAFPLSMFVGLTFWGLYLLDRELIFPTMLDQYFPVWLNHVMHTNIMIFTLLELVISYRKYPVRKVGLPILIVFMLVYLAWIHYINSKTNKWVYPILSVLNLPGRVAFFVMNLVVAILLYVLGEKINNIRWVKYESVLLKSKKLK